MPLTNVYFAFTQKDVAPPTDVDPAYFETSKFRVLDVYTGSIVSMPEGDLVPGAIECLPGQVLLLFLLQMLVLRGPNDTSES